MSNEKEFKCPYCFKKMYDREVKFRYTSSFVSGNSSDVFSKSDKYRPFWEKYGDTTESPLGPRKAIWPWDIPIIDPSDLEHLDSLEKSENGQALHKDSDGFTTHVKLLNGDICSERICTWCHNPLPDQYGKHPIYFISVIGITGSGKSVFLSQLFKNIDHYMQKRECLVLSRSRSVEELSPITNRDTVQDVIGATSIGQLQQPLIITIQHNQTKECQTLVMYDIAGECCIESDLAYKWGPFISEADGIICIIDPKQLESGNGRENDIPSEEMVLYKLHNNLTLFSDKRSTPLAIAISKSDISNIGLFKMYPKLQSPMKDLEDDFDDQKYSEIKSQIENYLKQKRSILIDRVSNNYRCYNYFAFSSLGATGGIKPINIMLPMSWLLKEFDDGGIREESNDFGADEEYVSGIYCNHCGKQTCKKTEPSYTFLNKIVSVFHKGSFSWYQCLSCGKSFEGGD